MAVPELLFPLTGEQRAVARRVAEVGPGTMLDEKDAKDTLRLKAAVLSALVDEGISAGAARIRDNLHSCAGPSGAADFIEQVAVG